MGLSKGFLNYQLYGGRDEVSCRCTFGEIFPVMAQKAHSSRSFDRFETIIRNVSQFHTKDGIVLASGCKWLRSIVQQKNVRVHSISKWMFLKMLTGVSLAITNWRVFRVSYTQT
eukprot:m.339927 g.339927  ORF g.339927 m.339927 type:complete len:114 (-) comp19041_c0_seq1:1553-1894(-)